MYECTFKLFGVIMHAIPFSVTESNTEALYPACFLFNELDLVALMASSKKKNKK